VFDVVGGVVGGLVDGNRPGMGARRGFLSGMDLQYFKTIGGVGHRLYLLEWCRSAVNIANSGRGLEPPGADVTGR
jgi:hypothetical protein